MKNLQGALILLACLFAFAAVVFFFKYNELRNQAKLLETNNLASQGEAIGAKIEADQKSGEASGMERLAAENAKKAKEAQEMLARFKAGSEEEKLAAIAEILRQGMSVARTEKYIDSLLTQSAPRQPKANVGAFLNSLTQNLQKIQLSGIPAVSERRETDSQIVLTITIPK